MDGNERFGRTARLARRADYLSVQRRGRCLSSGHYLMFVLRRNDDADGVTARVGITVSKKVGNAVTRNRVKRWVRESCRRMAALTPARTDLVVVAKPQAREAGYEVTADELGGLLRRACGR